MEEIIINNDIKTGKDIPPFKGPNYDTDPKTSSNDSKPTPTDSKSTSTNSSPKYVEPNLDQKNIGINANWEISNISELDFTKPAAYVKDQNPGWLDAHYNIHYTTGNKPNKDFYFRVFPVAVYWVNLGNCHVVGHRKFTLSQSKGFSRETKVAGTNSAQIDAAIDSCQHKFQIKRNFKGTETKFSRDQKLNFDIEATDKNKFLYQKYILYAHQSTTHGTGKESGISTNDGAVLRLNDPTIQRVDYGYNVMFSSIAAEEIYESDTDAPFQVFTERELIYQLLNDSKNRIKKFNA